MIADRFWPMTASRAVSAQPGILGSEAVTEAGPLLLTPAAVGFYFSFRAAIVLIAVRLFVLEPQTGVAVSLALEFLLLLVVAFQSVGSSERSLFWMLRQPSFRWVLAYLAFAGCSFAWTGAVSLAASFFYWVAVVADVAIVVLMLRTASVEAVAHSLIKGFIAATCVLAIVAWIMPVEADLRLGDLEYFNTNQIGNLCAFAILLAQYLMSRKDGKWGLAISFLTVTLVRSLSKTTLAAFVLSEGLLLMRSRSMRLRTKVLIVMLTLVVGLVFWGLFENYYDVYTTAGNQAETLTGRTAIWAYALNAALLKPWFGNGFDALWKVMPPFGADQFEARHAENEFLQQFFAYGVIGVGLLIGVYGSLYLRFRKLARSPMRSIFFTILIFILIRGFAEAEPFDLLLPLWAVTLIGALIATAQEASPSFSLAASPVGPGSALRSDGRARSAS